MSNLPFILCGILAVFVGVQSQQLSYVDVLQNAGKLIRNGVPNYLSLGTIAEVLSQIDEKQVLNIITDFLSKNENSTNGLVKTVSGADISADLPKILQMISNLPNADKIIGDILQYGHIPLNLLNTTDISSKNHNGSDLLSQISKSKEFLTNLLTSLGKVQTQISQISRKCMQHACMLVNAINERKMWALSMVDAMGKIPAGILEGNLASYGSFDECRKVRALVTNKRNQTSSPFRGKYCTAAIPVGFLLGVDKDSEALAALAYAQYLKLGVCIPDSCSTNDMIIALNLVLSQLPINRTIIAVSPNCYDNERKLDSKAIGALFFCGFIAALMVIGTGYDVIYVQWPKKKDKMHEKNEKTISAVSAEKGTDYMTNTESAITDQPGLAGKMILAFSVYTNGKKLLNTNQGSGSISSINGIRFLSMSWVILGHTFGFNLGISVNQTITFQLKLFGILIILPIVVISNRTSMSRLQEILDVRTELLKSANIVTYAQDLLNRWTFHAIANALISVDTFFALSGLLMSYLILREMKKKEGVKGINWGLFYFHRFWRMTPPYMILLFISVATMHYWGEGPLWSAVAAQAKPCTDNWWKNLLYINNFFPLEQLCFGWSWYLSNDMQFYVISPLLFIPLFYNEIFGVVVCMVFLIGTTIATGIVSYLNEIPPHSIGGGQDVRADETKYMEVYYVKPYCRMGPYIVGILAGYLLYKTKCRLRINRILNVCIWLVAAGIGCAILYGLYDPLRRKNPLTTEVSAFYNAVHRPAWGLCVCWVIVACATGNGGYVNTLLSWKAFVPLGRLSYFAYLVHPLLMEWYDYSLRKPYYLTDLVMIYQFLGHLVMAYGCAFVLSLAFEAPMMGLEKVIFGQNSNKAKKSTSEERKQAINGNMPYQTFQPIINSKMSDQKLYPDLNGDTFNHKF